ncbi:hypothetical protein B0J11DRAFT_437369 [Dendryphion nanum]|uniref:NAD(P)-binding protein n=1 Tax=Dendryphion nanum TaxID=256645 RepID=A0A9P9DN23_9PLEO|nr:hypothetical protein B0J11DRAFT_437369 [Dendryphion nanum]
MSNRVKDVTLANKFTKISHTSPNGIIELQHNKFSKPLNVCIIGASKGIGASIAYSYAEAGAASIILVARSSSSHELAGVQRRVEELNPTTRIISVACDITSSASVANLAKTVKNEVGRLDILIHNSGYSGPVVLRVEDGDPKDFQDVFDVNVQGTYLISHYFIPLLRESEGEKTFLVIGSFAAHIMNGHIANTAYCISKFAQNRLVEFISEQYGKEGILTIAIHPGAVATEMANATTPDSFRPYLTDDVGLCGAFCVWLTQEKRMWLNGRMVGATWDAAELLERRKEIEEGDLLKWGFRVGSSMS